jgi:hypothetical protein
MRLKQAGMHLIKVENLRDWYGDWQSWKTWEGCAISHYGSEINIFVCTHSHMNFVDSDKGYKYLI